MNLIKRWNEYLGPKDERLEAEENKHSRVSMTILFVGCILSLYYVISLNQVAEVTETPIMTPLGQSLVSVQWPLTITILAAAIYMTASQTRTGTFFTHTRFANVDRIPWDIVTLGAVACGLVVGVLSAGMRVLAEVQIVGLENVMWFGDAAIGMVFFIMGFVLGFAFIALSIRDAIKQRRAQEAEWEE